MAPGEATFRNVPVPSNRRSLTEAVNQTCIVQDSGMNKDVSALEHEMHNLFSVFEDLRKQVSPVTIVLPEGGAGMGKDTPPMPQRCPLRMKIYGFTNQAIELNRQIQTLRESIDL